MLGHRDQAGVNQLTGDEESIDIHRQGSDLQTTRDPQNR